jgi:hypothetical protein
VYYSFSFPEDYVGGHHRMYISTSTKESLPKKQRRKKKEKQGRGKRRIAKTVVSSAAADAITDENTPPMHNEFGDTCGYMSTTSRGAPHWILRPANRGDDRPISPKYDRVECLSRPTTSEIPPGY